MSIEEDLDLKTLKEIRDNTYGTMQLVDDIEIEKKCEREFNALNYAIKAIADRERLQKERRIQRNKAILDKKVKQLF